MPLLSRVALPEKFQMGIFSFFTGNKKNKQIADFLERGCIIADVRTPQEFAQGHIQGAKNFPLQQLGSQVNKIKSTGKPVITCCRSGMRSASAASLLSSVGVETINGGAWNSLNQTIKKKKQTI